MSRLRIKKIIIEVQDIGYARQLVDAYAVLEHGVEVQLPLTAFQPDAFAYKGLSKPSVSYLGVHNTHIEVKNV